VNIVNGASLVLSLLLKQNWTRTLRSNSTWSNPVFRSRSLYGRCFRCLRQQLHQLRTVRQRYPDFCWVYLTVHLSPS